MNRLSKAIKMGNALKIVATEVNAQLVGVSKQVPCLAGKPGIGKTESLEGLARDMGHEFIAVQMSAVFPEEFSGIPDFRDADPELAKAWSVTGSSSAKFTQWSIPELVTLVNQKAKEAAIRGKGVIVLFDDIHAADPTLERFMFNLLRQKRVGQYQLEENVALVAAMNDSGAAGFRGFNAAVLDRLAIYSVDFDFDHWYNNVVAADINTLVAAFLKIYHREHMLGEEDTQKITPSPRSWTELSALLNFAEESNVKFDTSELLAIVSAKVGEEAAAEFMKFKITYEKYNFDEKIKKRSIEEIGDDITEQIIWSNIVRHAQTREDGEYVIKLMAKNIEKTQFITSTVREIVSISQQLGKAAKNKKTAIGTIYHSLLRSEEHFGEKAKVFDDTISAILGHGAAL